MLNWLKSTLYKLKKKGKKSNKILKIQRIEQIILTFFIHIKDFYSQIGDIK